MKKQLMILGGGASGLAAAVTAAASGINSVAILEKLPRTGKKILATGNGRCNLSHAPIAAHDYSGSVDAEPILAEFGDAADFFASLGLHCRTDEQGRMYPYSMSASAVLDALRLACLQNGVEEICDAPVQEMFREGTEWVLRSDNAEYRADFVIFAAGGFAAPKLGTDGSAWKLLESLGIPLKSPAPILCPILSDERRLRPLKGLRVKASAALHDGENCIAQETGEVQFTQQALSGICLFNLAGSVVPDRLQDFTIVLDLLPDQKRDATEGILYSCQAVRYSADAETMLTGILQKPLARYLLKECGIPAAKPCCQLSGREMAAIAGALHHLSFPVTGLGSWDQAQATAGGVLGDALDENLQVRSCPGLYITGEACDVHGLCGGYHLHWAWASGCYAARRIAEKGGTT